VIALLYQNILELHLDLVFWFGIGWYFPGILPTDTKEKLGRDVLVSYIWRETLFSLKGRLLPPFWWTKPPIWGKYKIPPNLQKGVPAKFHKMELPPNLTVQKYRTEYRPASAGNLPIPAELPVNRWDATLKYSIFWNKMINLMYLCTGFSQNVLAVQKWIHSGYIYN
jgi:hypothetical protein